MRNNTSSCCTGYSRTGTLADALCYCLIPQYHFVPDKVRVGVRQ
jgi:hypothetical protein